MEIPIVFISHVATEGEIAKALQKLIERDFGKLVKVFVSSDGRSIKAGKEWLMEISKSLRQAQVEIVLCSPVSITRPWILFEAGAGWIRKIRMIPVCHSGTTPGGLPIPLNMLQGVVATKPESFRFIYDSLAEVLDTKAPDADFVAMAEDIRKLEVKLADVTKVPQKLAHMNELVAKNGDPDLRLHTFLGQESVPVPLTGEATFSDTSNVFHLWADAAHGSSIHASLDRCDGVELIRIRFSNQHGSLPGDVAIRPLGFRAIAVPEDRRFLVIDVRAPRNGQGNADRTEPLAVALRVIDALATQWSYQTKDMRKMFSVPVNDEWRRIVVDLRNDWVCFESDGNYYYAAERPDFSVISAIVFEVGGQGAVRPGPGNGELEVSRVCLSADAPSDGRFE